MIVLSFGHQVCFPRISSESCKFYAIGIARRRKACCHLRMSRILFAAKHNWRPLRVSRPLIVVVIAGHVVGSWPMKRDKNLHSTTMRHVHISAPKLKLIFLPVWIYTLFLRIIAVPRLIASHE